jgi:nucleotide-binding universal stress UspA family protein
MLPIRTILHPTDFSEHSRHAFHLACALARDYNARLIVMHVASPPTAIYDGGMMALQPDLDELRLTLEAVRPDDPKVRVEHQLKEGYAPSEIVNAAREYACDLIVLGTHGRSAAARLLMGSVAEPVVRKAHCPVLTVRMPAHLDEEAPTEAREPAAVS